MRLRTTCCAALVLLLLGCTQASVRPKTSPVTVEELLSGTALGLRQPAQGLVDEDEILAVSPEMVRFLDSYVGRDAGSFLKLHQLLYAIITEGSLIAGKGAGSLNKLERFLGPEKRDSQRDVGGGEEEQAEE